MPTRLTSRFDAAVSFARKRHGYQVRKGTDVLYISHLLAVSSLALEAGADEDGAIAALLHDVLEDTETTAAEIEDRFGPIVTALVEACTDTHVRPKPPWRARKEGYLAHLADAEPAALQISLCDKLHNARSIALALRTQGDVVWERFGGDDPKDYAWWYRALAEVFREQCPGPMADELAQLSDTIAEAWREHLCIVG